MAFSGSQITREAAGGWGERRPAGSFAGKASTTQSSGTLRRTMAGRLGRTIPAAVVIFGAFALTTVVCL